MKALNVLNRLVNSGVLPSLDGLTSDLLDEVVTDYQEVDNFHENQLTEQLTRLRTENEQMAWRLGHLWWWTSAYQNNRFIDELRETYDRKGTISAIKAVRDQYKADEGFPLPLKLAKELVEEHFGLNEKPLSQPENNTGYDKPFAEVVSENTGHCEHGSCAGFYETKPKVKEIKHTDVCDGTCGFCYPDNSTGFDRPLVEAAQQHIKEQEECPVGPDCHLCAEDKGE